MIRFIAKYRHMITALAAILMLGGMIYFGVKMNRLKDVHVVKGSYAGSAMGTVVKKSIYTNNTFQGEQVNKRIDDCLEKLEGKISVRLTDSEISKCNANYAVDDVFPISSDILEYLRQEIQISEETKGAYSPCIRPLADLWGIEDGSTRIPDEDVIKKTLEAVNAENMEIVDNGVILHAENMSIDFGASGKGIACDEAAKVLMDSDIQGAVISIGGSILVYGDKGDGRKWHVGVQDPRAPEGEVLGIIEVEGGKVVSTSGDYEKYFEQDGKRYHHILDPATGYPADSSLISVTIISDSGFLSDALSTACFVMGLEDGMAYAEEKGAEAVFITAGKEVYVTSGIKEQFQLRVDGYDLANESRME